MGKKKFIDKKTAATYQLICRATDDDGDGAEESTATLADERVLARVDKRGSAGEVLDDGEHQADGTRSVVTASSSHYTRSGRLTRARRAELIELGFPDDGYDYLQHCRVIGASGGAGAVFVPVTVKPTLADDERVYDARDAAKPTAVTAVAAEDMPKVARNAELELLVSAMREAQALTEQPSRGGRATGAAAGASSDEGEQPDEAEDGLIVVGDLEDDFVLSVLDADALPQPPGSASVGPATVLEALTEDDDEGSDFTDRDGLDMPDSDDEQDARRDDGLVVRAAQERVRRAPRHVDEAFEALAQEYDDDDIGELDDSDPRARGHADVSAYGAALNSFRGSSEGAAALAAARAAALADRAADGLSEDDSDADEFSTDEDSDEGGDDPEEDVPEEREAKLALQITRLRLGLPPSGRLRTQGDKEVIEQLAGAQEAAATQENDDEVMELRPVEVDAREREHWDCESIVSTYSNLENRPRLLDDDAPARRPPRAGSRAAANVSSAPQVIRLGKTGLPVDYLPAAKRGDVTNAEEPARDSNDKGVDVAPDAAWRANIRRKGETPEEKQARKQAVKQGRREARATKKDTRRLFQQEAKATKPNHVAGAVRPGTSVTPLQ